MNTASRVSRGTASNVAGRVQRRATGVAHVASSADVRAVAAVHKALADPTRLRILQRLSAGEGTVSDLRRHVDLSQPLVSWHLRRLRAAGLVETRRAGREVICSLSREALRRFHDIEHALLGIGG